VSRAVAAIALGAWLALASVAGADDSGSPHHMTKPDGELDMEACKACHTEDMSLERSKLETCTLCHGQVVHGGSDEHVRASPAAVKQAMEARPADAVALPLTDDGHIYCGTCHIFHDPKVMEESWLPQGWLPPDTGMSAAVRQSAIDRWAALAAKAGESGPIGAFAENGTRQLRLPIDHGQLCRQCHPAPR
jgi:hypothetical protein